MGLVVHLVRHAAHDGGADRLVGRDPAVGLSEAGREEARALAEALRDRPLAAVAASPQPRARQTAAFLAQGRGIEVAVEAGLDELDFGRWAGSSFATLEEDPAWRAWNAERALARTPAGESMADVAERVGAAIARLAAEHEGGAVALVSHLDTIRAYLCRALAIPFRTALSIEIATASATSLALDGSGARLLGLNLLPGFGARR